MAAIMVIPQGASKPYDGTALTSAGVTTYGLPAGLYAYGHDKGFRHERGRRYCRGRYLQH